MRAVHSHGMVRAVLAALVVLGLVSGCGSSSDPKGVAGPSEVALEKVSSPTDNPFTPPVGTDEAKVQPPPATAAGGRTTFVGSLPGLYGGTRDSASCDADKLVGFLDANPAKATAWARVFGIPRSQIPDFVDDLTPVLLRTDTRVTNHGFVNGVATPVPALLQAGTAVFVNRYGEPVVKCYCGNPLTAATPVASPRYVGPQWAGYAPGRITIIEQSVTIIDDYTLYDPDTGGLFARPAGTDGTRDRPAGERTPEAPPAQPEPTTTPPPAPPAQTTTEAPSTPVEQPSASFSPSTGTVNDTYTLSASGFAPNTTLQVTLTRPDGATESYSISTGSDGSGSYTFPHSGDPPLGTYTALVVNPGTGAEARATTTVSG